FLDLVGIRTCTVPAEQELDDVSRHRKLPTECPHQILSDQVAIQRVDGKAIDLIKLQTHLSTPIVTCSCASSTPSASSTTSQAVLPSSSSFSTISEQVPCAENFFLATTMLLPGSPATRRTSADTSATGVSSDTESRRPFQPTSPSRTCPWEAFAFEMTANCTVKHSCKLSPPWAYSSPCR